MVELGFNAHVPGSSGPATSLAGVVLYFQSFGSLRAMIRWGPLKPTLLQTTHPPPQGVCQRRAFFRGGFWELLGAESGAVEGETSFETSSELCSAA